MQIGQNKPLLLFKGVIFLSAFYFGGAASLVSLARR